MVDPCAAPRVRWAGARDMHVPFVSFDQTTRERVILRKGSIVLYLLSHWLVPCPTLLSRGTVGHGGPCATLLFW